MVVSSSPCKQLNSNIYPPVVLKISTSTTVCKSFKAQTSDPFVASAFYLNRLFTCSSNFVQAFHDGTVADTAVSL
ncbi:unnamed protein product [Miscanthus lutarioriparius]|uniref:Uncharacterized protein n=1 Tax=Miscanthus lutarioriparius TaxID=422564 RepID=A0A811RAK0_9POAL|nr:unnamed protein product [Miscanthus lutarioriparius]